MTTAMTAWLGRTAVFRHPCALGTLVAGLTLCGFALAVDLPRSAYGLKGDESTYYCMAYSLAMDGDLVYRRGDLARVWKEFPAGPEGIFLKRGKRVDWSVTSQWPFLHRQTSEDGRPDRLYYGKAYIYPLFAAPFVRILGTHGFLLFHALLLTSCVAAGAAFLRARAAPGLAIGYALVFLFCSVVPVYLVWISPEVFNFGLAFHGCFLWLYKETVPVEQRGRGWWGAFLRSRWSDYAAAVLFGMATFSKPIHVVLIVPVLVWAAARRRWRHAVGTALVFAALVSGLFAVNAAITGEFNYQGGDRNTFYGRDGFPLQNESFTFRSAGDQHATDSVPLEVLVNRDALLTVFPRNLVYFFIGRHSGVLPYFCPAVISLLLFILAWRRWQRWQLLLAGTLALAVVGLLLYMPYTYSGGGGSLGNRYLMGFYPLFLFLTPPLRSVGAILAGTAIGGLFTAQLLANPFYGSYYPADLPTRWPFRLLPVELSLIDDLPVSLTASRVKQPLIGDPPLYAYFLDDNAFRAPEGVFWVRGESSTQLVLRVPARQLPDGTWEPLRLWRLRVELRTGDVGNDIVVSVGPNRRVVRADPHATVVVYLDAGTGFPFRRIPGRPANYLHLVTVSSRTGFVPMFSSGGSDHRFLGVQVRLDPVYAR